MMCTIIYVAIFTLYSLCFQHCIIVLSTKNIMFKHKQMMFFTRICDVLGTKKMVSKNDFRQDL